MQFISGCARLHAQLIYFPFFRFQKVNEHPLILHLIHDCGTFTSTKPLKCFMTWLSLSNDDDEHLHQLHSINCELPKKEPRVKSSRMKFNKAHWYMKSSVGLKHNTFPVSCRLFPLSFWMHPTMMWWRLEWNPENVVSEKNERCARC